MIYFDAAATALQKPPKVAQAMVHAVAQFGNPGRSFAPPAMDAARMIYQARAAVARLTGADDPAQVAFTSGCTEAISLICRTLSPNDHVITTELEHNSVLRPLYLSGCKLGILRCDERGRLMTDEAFRLMRCDTRYVMVSHGSNVTGMLTDIAPIYTQCKALGVPLVLDAAQTMGSAVVSMDMADILCFSGHKGLMGPMGTGGLVVREGLALPMLKTGGTGADSFSERQHDQMPDLAEAGTPNVPGIAGLAVGLHFIECEGLERIIAHERALTQAFIAGISDIPRVRLMGEMDQRERLPVVSFLIEGMDSAEAALRIWEQYEIATRAGSHCAPLLHKRLGTERTGLVRCSFGHFNTMDEVARGIEAIKAVAHG